ncbi:MAG TPA: response regulator transcription factor [Vicinamibacterales bacterium]|jgi:DNA-binding NarL/FixJ family response regulator|nr:response regulator transcription factor [Vicinamibacterales bacterium]
MAVASRPIRVLCVDDHRLMREGVARIVGVQPDMKVVAEASNGEQAVAQFLASRPDVTLMDLQLPGTSGPEATRRIRQIDHSARIIVLTMYHGDEDIHRAFEAGAMGYVLKDTISDDLIHVIREVHAGRRVVTPEIQQALDERARQPTLSVRERQVLELVAEGMRNKEIAAALGISTDTTGMHVKNIYTKLDVHDRTAAVAKAIRRGIIRIE